MYQLFAASPSLIQQVSGHIVSPSSNISRMRGPEIALLSIFAALHLNSFLSLSLSLSLSQEYGSSSEKERETKEA